MSETPGTPAPAAGTPAPADILALQQLPEEVRAMAARMGQMDGGCISLASYVRPVAEDLVTAAARAAVPAAAREGGNWCVSLVSIC